MKQVCGLGPHLHEYKCIYEHRCSGFPIRSYQKQPSQPQRLDRNSEVSLGARLNTILFNVYIAKALIRLRGCASWSVPLLFADRDGRIPRVHLVNLE